MAFGSVDIKFCPYSWDIAPLNFQFVFFPAPLAEHLPLKDKFNNT